jgi:hypothetical protein
MVFIVVARFYEGNFHITITNGSHIVTRLPTSTCVILNMCNDASQTTRKKRPEKNTAPLHTSSLFYCVRSI